MANHAAPEGNSATPFEDRFETAVPAYPGSPAGRSAHGHASRVRLQAAGVIIVDRGIFEIAPRAIGDTKVLTAIVGGTIANEAAAK